MTKKSSPTGPSTPLKLVKVGSGGNLKAHSDRKPRSPGVLPAGQHARKDPKSPTTFSQANKKEGHLTTHSHSHKEKDEKASKTIDRSESPTAGMERRPSFFDTYAAKVAKQGIDRRGSLTTAAEGADLTTVGLLSQMSELSQLLSIQKKTERRMSIQIEDLQTKLSSTEVDLGATTAAAHQQQLESLVAEEGHGRRLIKWGFAELRLAMFKFHTTVMSREISVGLRDRICALQENEQRKRTPLEIHEALAWSEIMANSDQLSSITQTIENHHLSSQAADSQCKLAKAETMLVEKDARIRILESQLRVMKMEKEGTGTSTPPPREPQMQRVEHHNSRLRSSSMSSSSSTQEMTPEGSELITPPRVDLLKVPQSEYTAAYNLIQKAAEDRRVWVKAQGENQAKTVGERMSRSSLSCPHAGPGGVPPPPASTVVIRSKIHTGVARPRSSSITSSLRRSSQKFGCSGGYSALTATHAPPAQSPLPTQRYGRSHTSRQHKPARAPAIIS